MTEHITSCVRCGGELSDEYDAYCSGKCKAENECARTEPLRKGGHALSFDGHDESY